MRRSGSFLTCLRCAGALALLISGGAAAQSVTVDTRAAFTYDDNVNRTERGRLREADAIWSFGADAGYRRALGANHGVIAKLGFDTDIHTDVGDLDVVRAKSSLTYLIQPFAGFNAPWFAVSAGYLVAEYAASDIRDGSEAHLAVALGQRFTDRIAARLGYAVRDRDASKGDVYELHTGNFHALGEYTVNNRVGAYLKYDFTHGEVVTGAPRTAKLLAVRRVVARDRVFGPNNVAWRLNGEVHGLRLGSKITLAKRTALDVSAQHSITDADGDNQWNVWSLSVSLNHRFD